MIETSQAARAKIGVFVTETALLIIRWALLDLVILLFGPINLDVHVLFAIVKDRVLSDDPRDCAKRRRRNETLRCDEDLDHEEPGPSRQGNIIEDIYGGKLGIHDLGDHAIVKGPKHRFP